MPRPRVISEFIASPVSSSLAASLRIPAIIGEGATTFTVTEQVTKGSAGGQDTLAHTATSIIRVGNFSTTTDFQATTDYLLTAGKVDWSPAGAEPTTGAKYYVTYVYAKVTADLAPKLFDNYNSILSNYGPITLDNNGILTPASYITMAAQIMMGAGIGATNLIVVQINPSVPGSPVANDFSAALTLLQNSVGAQKINPYYITPLGGKLSDADVAVVNGACLNHAILMADPQFRKERRIYTGQKNNSSYANVISACQGLQADTINSGRLTMLANFDPTISIGTNSGNKEVLLDGFFAAAALAGFRSNQVVSQPALNKLLPAFDGFKTEFSSTQIDTLDDNGATVLENIAGSIRTVNDVTVNIVNDIEKSIPTVETRDVLISTLRRRLYSTIVGLRGSPAIPAQIEQITDQFLEEERGNGDIQAFSPSKASRQTGSTTKFNVTFSYFPAGEVLEIKVIFSIDLSLA
jgi:hypothetical protein